MDRMWSVLLLMGMGSLWLLAPAAAQDPLYMVNEETEINEVSFRFTGGHVFDEEDLQTQIVTRGPGFWDKVKGVLPLLNATDYPFDPVQLARDVYRLEQYYDQNGFPEAKISYRASQLDTTKNTIHVIFTVAEGSPLIIQDVQFLAVGGDELFYTIPEDERENWIRLRREIALERGDRYTRADQFFIEGAVAGWFRNRGYAFARVYTDVEIDEDDNLVDLAFVVDPGPRGYVSEILVEGAESVDESVIRRELPFEVGDLFRYRELVQGQRELYTLNLFRVALIDVPADQPRDSTVTVVVRVAEAKPRYVSAQAGYAIESGFNGQTEWTHRNFLGGARTFTASAVAQSGVGSTPIAGEILPSRLYRIGVTLTQPYFFTRKLSATAAPYVQFESDPQLAAIGGAVTLTEGDPLNIDTRLYGVNTTLIYEFFPYRTLTFQHSYQRALQRSRVSELDTLFGDVRIRDLYNRSVFSLTGIVGDADNFVNPNDGYLFRPFAEAAGTILGSDVEYVKLGSEFSAYRPLTMNGDYGLAGRLLVGRLWPLGSSEEALFGEVPERDSLIFENRFDPVLFYAGGPTLRGWDPQLAGKKVPKPVIVPRREEVESPLNPDSTRFVPDTLRFIYEPLGGLAALGANLELRMPFPGLSSNWRTAAFVDAAMIGDRGFAFDDIFTNVGVGIRYKTLIGFLRLDIAYKLNPTFEDLRRPEEVFEYYQALDRAPPGVEVAPPEERFWRRFNLQFSIGPAF